MHAPHPFALSVPELMPKMEVNYVRFDENGYPTADIVACGIHTLTIAAVFDDHVEGEVKLFGFESLSFEEYGVPFDRNGPWNSTVCLVPRNVAMDLMREYENAHRPAVNKPGYQVSRPRLERQLISSDGRTITPHWATKPGIPN
jgi:hypothetical protein